MDEVEVKILDINPEEIRKKLLAAGAVKTFEGPMEAKVFDFPDLRLKNNDGYIRLRKAGDKVEMTYKGTLPSKEFKKREEIETHVEDHDAVMDMLLRIGMKEVKSYKKKRESYRLGNINFDMDFYSEPFKLNPMVEVESTEDGVKKGVQLLGYSMQDTSKLSAWSLFDLHKKTKEEQK
jgi:adenylate cyclase class 2